MPPCGFLEEAGLLVRCAGEGALRVTEELALEERFGDRAAVHRDEGFLRARAGIVHEARDELLAGAALAGEQHSAGVARHFASDVERGAHRGAAAHDLVLPADSAQLALERRDALAQLLALGRFAHHQRHLVGTEGLGHVVVRALLHRGDRDVGIAVGGHCDDQRAAAGGGIALDHVDAGHRGHPQVAEYEVDVLGGEALEALLAVAGGDGRVSLRAEDASERLAQARLVIHDQDLHVLSIAAIVAGVGSTPPSGTGR